MIPFLKITPESARKMWEARMEALIPRQWFPRLFHYYPLPRMQISAWVAMPKEQWDSRLINCCSGKGMIIR